MAENVYHLLSFMPVTEAWEMPPALETLARQLVASGKLRINADHERNFVAYGTSSSDLTFTARELTDPMLAATTRVRLQRLVAPAAGEDGIAALRARLVDGLKKARGVAAAKELRVARVLVQAADPAVIQLLIQTGAEVYVSYSHNVADLMPVHAWETHGTASGLQATEDTGAAVYVSAGGDPFFDGEHKTYATDGFPALARMVVIAGQELGHFADLRRTIHGVAGRYSVDAHHSQLRADPVAAASRLKDMQNIELLSQNYQHAGLWELRHVEQKVSFYHNRLRFSPPWWFWQGMRFGRWMLFISQCKKIGLAQRFSTLPRTKTAEGIVLYLADMRFNLAPEAEAYRHPDPLVEEAIAVIESVARVPQQALKWGERGVAAGWPNLHRFYYGGVLPACAHALKLPLTSEIMSLPKMVTLWLRRRIRARPGYYPD